MNYAESDAGTVHIMDESNDKTLCGRDMDPGVTSDDIQPEDACGSCQNLYESQEKEGEETDDEEEEVTNDQKEFGEPRALPRTRLGRHYNEESIPWVEDVESDEADEGDDEEGNGSQESSEQGDPDEDDGKDYEPTQSFEAHNTGGKREVKKKAQNLFGGN